MKKKYGINECLNRFGALFLAVLLLVSGMPMTALAEEGDAATGAVPAEVQDDIMEEVQIPREVIVPNEGQLPDSDELLEQYIDKLAFGETSAPEIPQPGGKIKLKAARRINLNANEKEVYDAIKSAIKDIADGNSVFTIIEVPVYKYFPVKEILASDLDLGIIFSIADIDVDKIFDSLLMDCPYELYWFNKVYDQQTGTGAFSYNLDNIGVYNDDETGVILSENIVAEFYFSVADAYKDVNSIDDPETEDVDEREYTTDADSTRTGSTAVTAAQAVVTNNKSLSDYDKLLAYKDYICNNVEYNFAAVDNNEAYGNPWQLIWVFDNDENTNVVCEGYAKAFKFLCDLTKAQNEFSDNTIECHIVTGNMGGGTGEGNHMWNIVSIGGNNYLVDVTNSDSGTIGYPNKLFLIGQEKDPEIVNLTVTENGVGRTVQSELYAFPSLRTDDNKVLTYLYDFDTVSSYSESERLLATSNYEPSASTTIATPTNLAWLTSADDIPNMNWDKNPEVGSYEIQLLKGNTVVESVTRLNVEDTIESLLPSYMLKYGPGKYTFRVAALPAEGSEEAKSEYAESEVFDYSMAITEARATVANVLDKYYTGSPITQSPTVTLSGTTKMGDKYTYSLREGTDYTLTYKNNTKVGTATVTIKGKGNYTGTVNKTFKINTKYAKVRRIFGQNRIDTGNKISTEFAKDTKQTKKLPGVIVVNGNDKFSADAYSAGTVSAQYNVPIILTYADAATEKTTLNWIKKNVKKGGTVYIVGGEFVVRKAFQNSVKRAGYKVDRRAGADRIGTNITVLKKYKLKATDELLVANGWEWENALVASAVGKPLLLVNGTSLTPAQTAFLKNIKVSKITIVGNQSSVNKALETALKKYTTNGKNVERINAAKGEAMCVAVSKKFWPDGPKEVFLATAKSAGDALSGGPECIHHDGPLFLVTDQKYSKTAAYLKSVAVNRVTVFGGELAVTNALVKKCANVK